MRRMKCYFMVGLPEEEDEDVAEMARLGRDMKGRLDAAGHGTELVMSVGPLVPKPATAYQHLPQTDARVVNGRLRMLRGRPQGHGHRAAGRQPRLGSDRRHLLAGRPAADAGDPLDAGQLARLVDAGGVGVGPRRAAALGRGPDAVERRRHGITARFFEREWDKHLRSKFTIACPPPEIGCKLCGVC